MTDLQYSNNESKVREVSQYISGHQICNIEFRIDFTNPKFSLIVNYDSCLKFSDDDFETEEELIYPIEDMFFSDDNRIL